MSIFPDPSPTQPPAPPAAPPPYAPPPGSQPPPQAPPYYAVPPQYYPPAPPPAKGGSGWKTGLLFGMVIALIAANVYLYTQLDKVKKDLAATNDAAQSRLDKLEEATNLTTRANRRTVEELRDQLEAARRQANLAAGQARDEALKKVDETRAALQAAQAAQEQANRQLSTDISKVKESTDTQFNQVGTEVTNVKGDVAATKSQLEKTVAELKRATGELDGHSVLIATNGKELAALQALGERNYVQFTIQKSKKPQKVADVGILLKKADPKKNRYTIELTADDKTVEKKDRNINEPLQFMTSKAKQPYEIVVNDVKKNEIVGYLSIPKVLNGRN